mmetsp:Transcript_18988/g.46623  ORF Transcript_18988/g.46623 Transcript_18988/m.46623 type:complete len:80 (-) Transcript_18988:340-579(-)
MSLLHSWQRVMHRSPTTRRRLFFTASGASKDARISARLVELEVGDWESEDVRLTLELLPSILFLEVMRGCSLEFEFDRL